MPASVMTMPEATKAVQMHQQGYSQPQIAAALGRSRTAVRTALRQLDVQPRSPVEGYRAWLALRGGVGNKKQIAVSPLELEPPASHRAVDSAHLPPTVRTTRSDSNARR